jgi:hypothetical protein
MISAAITLRSVGDHPCYPENPIQRQREKPAEINAAHSPIFAIQ